MKWIHVECLNQWRRTSKKESRLAPSYLPIDLITVFSAVMSVVMNILSESTRLIFLLRDVIFLFLLPLYTSNLTEI
jgi:hypothetical protein